jgi:hypothetical protein
MSEDNVYLDRVARRGVGFSGRKAEKKVSKKLGGRLTLNSGASGQKGDIDLADFRVESKATTADSMGIKLEWLSKISRESLGVGKSPALALSFVTDTGDAKRHGEWVAIPLHVFKELVGGS